MKRTLTLEIPDDLYEPLAKLAEQKGQSTEELAAELFVVSCKVALDDPLEKYIGAFTINVPGWTKHIDEYIGQALYDEMQSGNKED